MRVALVCAFALLVACKDRGTITIPLLEPCDGRTPSAIAVYLKPATTCATEITDPQSCGLLDFECTGDCVALCANGYCEPAEVRDGLAVEPPRAGDYALVMTFRYGTDAVRDEGVACFDVTVDADGTESSAITDEEGVPCCVP